MREYLVILRAELFGLFISPRYLCGKFLLSFLACDRFQVFHRKFCHDRLDSPSPRIPCNRTCIRSPRSHSFPDHEIIRRRKKAWNVGNADVGPSGEASRWFSGNGAPSYLFFLLICGCAFCFPLLLLLMFPDQGATLGFTNFEQWIGGWLFLMAFGVFSAVGIFAIRHSESNGRRHAFIHPSYALSRHHGLFFGRHAPQTESIDQFSDFWNASLGSFGNGLHKLQHFAVGLIDVGTIFHQLILGFFFLSLATLQIERLNH